MNVFLRVALKSLWKNKTRTAVTVIGIILSAAMICAVTTFTSSIYNYALENAIYKYGDWHGSAQNLTFEELSAVTSAKKVKKAVYARQIGYAIAEGCLNEDKPYLYILGAEKNFEETMSIHLTSGRFPKNSGEILLPLHLSENGGIIHKIGDTLTLDVGHRISEGFEFWQHNPYCYEEIAGERVIMEELDIKETRTYTVVGFYERPAFEPYTAPGYTALTLSEEADKDLLCSVWLKMKNPRDVFDFLLDDVYALTNTDTSPFIDTNDSVLTYSGATGYGNLDFVITSMAVIVIALIMFGSVALIYNAFSISVSERTKQFGLLSSIGATKKQLRKIVMYEALAVGMIGIPLGVLSGIGGIGVTLLLVGDRFENLFDYAVPLRLSVSPLSVVAAALIAVITVLISALIPSRRATKVSAMDAIRQTRDITVKNAKVKTSNLTYKLFGFPGMLAAKYYKRSKKKYRATVLSLFMSIVLFVSAVSFTNYLIEANEGRNPADYDIVFHHRNYEGKMTEKELLTLFKEDAAVTEVAYSTESYEVIEIDKKYVSDAARDDTFGIVRDLLRIDSEKVDGLFTRIMFVDDAAYEKLVKKNKLGKEYLNAEIPKAIVIDTFTSFNVETERYENIDIIKGESIEVALSAPKRIEGYSYPATSLEDNGKLWLEYSKDDTNISEEGMLKVPLEEYMNTVHLTLGDSIEERPFYADKGGLQLIYPISVKDKLFPTDWTGSVSNEFDTTFFFTSSDHEKSYEAIKHTLSENGIPSGGVNDYAEADEEVENLIMIIRVFAYGFIVLISLIAAANVFNTISTNISLRRREFAMLKSVGMTAGGFNRMMCFECLLYGSKALLYGLPVSAVVTYIIFLAVHEGFDVGFAMPWSAIGIAAFSVFAVVFVTMMYSMRKIKKDNPIDALRNENL